LTVLSLEINITSLILIVMVARSGASNQDILLNKTGSCLHFRDVTAGATGATAVASKFSDALSLFQPSQRLHRGYISVFMSHLQ
jgi:hypothetical protein